MGIDKTLQDFWCEYCQMWINTEFVHWNENFEPECPYHPGVVLKDQPDE